MENIACFDVGGTFIKYAIINFQGDIIIKDKYETPIVDCKNTIPSSIIEKIRELRKSYDIHGIGISTAGIVDAERGIVTYAPNLNNYNGTTMVDTIKSEIDLPVAVENDVNAAAIGEMWMGSAKGRNTFVCITIGTGVGSGIVVNGKVLRGVNGAAGELGHVIINEEGKTCNCGHIGCYERYASTSSFIRSYAEASGIKEINGEEIMKRVDGGEKLAIDIYNEFLDHITTGIVNLVHLLDPGLVVIGGGISAQGDRFFNEIRKRFSERALNIYSKNTDIIQAKLVNDAGMYGACYLALSIDK